jgi:multicomponent Na+:H+ antiporter subunit E
MFILNMFLAIIWAAVTGEVTLANTLAGFVIGYGILWLVYTPLGRHWYFEKTGLILRFSLFFLRELWVASWRVVVDVVTPQHLMKPAVLAIPIETESATETTTLANVITLTPGTLVLHVAPDNKTLYVHAMYAGDLEQARHEIEIGLGRRVREIFS